MSWAALVAGVGAAWPPSPASAVCARSAARTRAARSDWSTRAIPLPRWRSAMGPWRRVPCGQA